MVKAFPEFRYSDCCCPIRTRRQRLAASVGSGAWSSHKTKAHCSKATAVLKCYSPNHLPLEASLLALGLPYSSLKSAALYFFLRFIFFTLYLLTFIFLRLSFLTFLLPLRLTDFYITAEPYGCITYRFWVGLNFFQRY